MSSSILTLLSIDLIIFILSFSVTVELCLVLDVLSIVNFLFFRGHAFPDLPHHVSELCRLECRISVKHLLAVAAEEKEIWGEWL